MYTQEDARAWLKENTTYSDELAHFGVLGMRWGIRKNRGSSEAKPERTEAQKASFRKHVLIGAAAAAVLVAGAATAFVVRDRTMLKKTKDLMVDADLSYELLFSKSAQLDQKLARGAEFVRHSVEKNGEWGNGLRTYVADKGGKTEQFISLYGRHKFNFRAKEDINIAGLKTQMDLLGSAWAKPIKDLTIKDQARFAPATKKYIESLTGDKFATYTLERLRRSAFAAGSDVLKNDTEGITREYLSLLRSKGYSAVHDLNLPEQTAKILINKLVFDVAKL